MRFGGALSPWLIASFYGLLSVCLADDCVVSSDADYDYEVSASDDFIIYWTVDSDSEEITFKAIYSGNAWVGVGFSADGKMIGSDAVIGLPDDKTVFEYDLADKIVEAVTKSTIQNISAEDIVQEGGETTLVFTRPLSPTDPSKISLSSEEGEEAIFIWGAGKDNTLAEHAHKGSVTVTDIYCSGLAAATKDECSSSDPEFDFEVAPSSRLTLFWSVVESDTAVSVKAVYEGEGWLGIGFSDSGSMIGSDAVVGLPDENTVLEYDMDAHDTPSESPEQKISDASITQADGVTTLTFVRPLGPSGDGKQVLSVEEETAWLYAWGSGNDFEEHTQRGSFDLNLTSCAIVATEVDGSKKKFAHGWLMVLSWGVCFPAGIMFARFSPNFTKIGFPVHRALQSLGAVLALAGFFVAVSFTSDFGGDHFDHSHGVSGLILAVFLPLQVGAASLRPKKLSGNTRVLIPDGTAPPKESKIRLAWQYSHIGLGYIAAVWGLVQCLGGLYFLDSIISDNWGAAYVLLLAAILVIFMLLQLNASCCTKLRPQDLPNPVQGEINDEGRMDPEPGELESPSAGTGLEKPGQQCLPNWEIGRTTAAGCLPVSMGSNFGENTFPLAETAVGRRADSEITTPSTASNAVFLQTSRKPKDKKTASEENKEFDPGGKGGEPPP